METVTELKEKARKFDELQSWYWWLERRTYNGRTPSSTLRKYMNETKEYFEPYEEERA